MAQAALELRITISMAILRTIFSIHPDQLIFSTAEDTQADQSVAAVGAETDTRPDAESSYDNITPPFRLLDSHKSHQSRYHRKRAGKIQGRFKVMCK